MKGGGVLGPCPGTNLRHEFEKQQLLQACCLKLYSSGCKFQFYRRAHNQHTNKFLKSQVIWQTLKLASYVPLASAQKNH